jgi:hypothetical protein
MKTSEHNITVAIAADFLSAFSRIPRDKQTKVLDFITKFRTNPTSSGINYEKIHGAKDANLRSVRIDRSFRGIVLKPEQGNVYVLLWVDHHDRAYAWAASKVAHVHPDTGSLQIVDVAASHTDNRPEHVTHQENALFAGIRDRHLIRLGVPEVLLPMVRGLKTEADLDHVAELLPAEAYEALFFLASGYSLDDVFLEMSTSETPAEVDTNDYKTALENHDSQRRFFVVEDELELAAMLHAPLEHWRVFLHPSQRVLVERNWHGPVRILGGAGTGKTVVAIHRAKWLAQHVFTGLNDGILFTTFTRNLAADIRDNLGKICSEETMRRIEVVNLDKWVADFLRRHGYGYTIDYGQRTAALWQQALTQKPDACDLTPRFYREEWERVIQPQGIATFGEYIQASRVGRGTPLSRKERRAIWPVFEDYRALLNEHGLRESDDAMQDARLLLENTGHILPYGAIIVDEAQDMSSQAWRLLRQMIPGERQNDLFVVGDAHQRIYRHQVVLSRCGIHIRGRSKTLKINYRTTDETRQWAVNLLEDVHIDDLDGGSDNHHGYKSLLHGAQPTVRCFSSFQKEIAFITQYLKQLAHTEGSLAGACLVARTNELIKQYENALGENGLETYRIRRSMTENRRAPGLRLATIHRVKGLEFDHMIIAGVNDGIMPYESEEHASSDLVIHKEADVRERALLYVAATRAKQEVVVTSFGKASRLLVEQ